MKLKKWIGFIIMIGLAFLFSNCKKSTIAGEPEPPYPVTIVSFDEANVKTVTIGNKVWMAENLKVTVNPAGNPLGCESINGDNSLDDLYGKIYTYQQALDACPPGWHLPSIDEWNELFNTLGGIDIAGGKMKTVDYWDQPNVGASNSSGFSALPAGPYDGFGWSCHFWSSTEDGDNAYIPSLMNNIENAYILYDQSKTLKISVRYIKD